MALGGGTFLFHNKSIARYLYINFVSKDRAYAEVSDRGFGAMMLSFDWGPSGEVFRVDNDTFQRTAKNTLVMTTDMTKWRAYVTCSVAWKLVTSTAKLLTVAKLQAQSVKQNIKVFAVTIWVYLFKADPDNTGKFIVTTYPHYRRCSWSGRYSKELEECDRTAR